MPDIKADPHGTCLKGRSTRDRGYSVGCSSSVWTDLSIESRQYIGTRVSVLGMHCICTDAVKRHYMETENIRPQDAQREEHLARGLGGEEPSLYASMCHVGTAWRMNAGLVFRCDDGRGVGFGFVKRGMCFCYPRCLWGSTACCISRDGYLFGKKYIDNLS